MTENDLSLKLEMERVLWAAGYYTRCNVKLASAVRPSDGSRRRRGSADLTDVDVLGIRFLDDLESRKIAVDCKSSPSVSPVGRTFWLKGVMDHVGAGRGYVVLSRAIPEHQRAAAANLGITLVDEPALPTLSARYPSLNARLRIGDRESHNYFESNIIRLPKQFHSLLDLRDTTFWYISSARAISQAVQRTRKIRNDIDFRQKFQKALLLDVAALFSLAVLDIACDVSRLASSDLLDSIRSTFFGGPEGVARREQLMRSIEVLVRHVTQQAKLPIDVEESFELDPPYLPAVAEIVARLVAHPLHAAEAPRYLKLRLVHGALYGENDLADLLGIAYSSVADKLAGDIALAYMKASGFDLQSTKELGAIN